MTNRGLFRVKFRTSSKVGKVLIKRITRSSEVTRGHLCSNIFRNFVFNSQAVGVRYCLGCRNGLVSPFCLFFLYFLLDRIFCARQKQNLFLRIKTMSVARSSQSASSISIQTIICSLEYILLLSLNS